MRLIDADALKRWLETNKANANPLDYNTKATYAECITMVENMEAIEAEPVRHGKWIVQDETYTRCFCSECKSGNHQGHEKFYPNCGAKMDLEGE